MVAAQDGAVIALGAAPDLHAVIAALADRVVDDGEPRRVHREERALGDVAEARALDAAAAALEPHTMAGDALDRAVGDAQRGRVPRLDEPALSAGSAARPSKTMLFPR